jgi:hypothetical protein
MNKDEKEGYFENFTNNSIPTPSNQEDIASTDMINDVVGSMIDNMANSSVEQDTQLEEELEA